jgi:MurNAc alpha-1-phosphate uridylyltransferase
LQLLSPNLAHLVMVDNPPQHPDGDFFVDSEKVTDQENHKLTFSGVGIYHPALFADVERGEAAKLAPLLRSAMAKGLVTGEHYQGVWHDIGTPERLTILDKQLSHG